MDIIGTGLAVRNQITAHVPVDRCQPFANILSSIKQDFTRAPYE